MKFNKGDLVIVGDTKLGYKINKYGITPGMARLGGAIAEVTVSDNSTVHLKESMNRWEHKSFYGKIVPFDRDFPKTGDLVITKFSKINPFSAKVCRLDELNFCGFSCGATLSINSSNYYYCLLEDIKYQVILNLDYPGPLYDWSFIERIQRFYSTRVEFDVARFKNSEFSVNCHTAEEIGEFLTYLDKYTDVTWGFGKRTIESVPEYNIFGPNTAFYYKETQLFYGDVTMPRNYGCAMKAYLYSDLTFPKPTPRYAPYSVLEIFKQGNVRVVIDDEDLVEPFLSLLKEAGINWPDGAGATKLPKKYEALHVSKKGLEVAPSTYRYDYLNLSDLLKKVE